MTKRLSDGPFLSGALDATDLLEITDKSDTSESPQGTTKIATYQQVLDGVPSGGGGITAGSPFVQGQLLRVQATSGDGVAQTVGFADTDLARLSTENNFALGQRYNSAGLTISPDPSQVAFMYAPDGTFNPLDGGIVAKQGKSELHGTVTSVESLKFINVSVPAYQVWTNSSGELFGIAPSAPAWEISATDSTNTALGSGTGTGPWVELTGFTPALTLPQNIAATDLIVISTRFLLVNLSSNQNGLVDVGFGFDGAQPAEIGETITVASGFSGYAPASWAREGITATAGQVISVWARTRGGSGGAYSVVADGAISPHSVTISQEDSGSSVSTAIFRTQHTFAISGAYSPGDAVAEFRIDLAGGQTASLVRVSTWNGTGTGQITVNKDGTPIGAYSNLPVGTAWADTTGAVPAASNDRYNLTIDASTGGELLSVTLSFEYTVTLV